VLSASVWNDRRSRLLQPQRNVAVLRLPDSFATPAWPPSPNHERVAGGVTLAAVADLGQQFGGGDHAAFEEREEDRAVGMLADLGGDLPLELLDLLADEFDHRDQCEDQSAAGGQFLLAEATGGRAPELGQQL
jgi:hypothetical protein